MRPVHIGNGVKYGPLEYYVEAGKLNRVDFQRMVSDPEFAKHSDSIINFALNKGSMRSIREIACGLAEKYPLYSLELKYASLQQGHSQEVQEQIKTNGMPYIPASSIKGSLLTAIAYDYFSKNSHELSEIREYGYHRRGKEAERIIEKAIGSIFTGNAAIQPFDRKQDRFLRWLRISDPAPVPLDRLYVASIATYPRGPPLIMEMIKQGTKFELEFEPTEGVDLGKILDKANTFYSRVLERENQWRARHGLSRLDFSAYMRNGKQAIVKVGSGSSKIATSMALLRGDPEPKTRKLVIPEKEPIGWISLCIAE